MVSESLFADNQKATVGDYVAEWLEAHKISHVFTLPGGMIAPLLDAIYRRGTPEIVTMHHEQAVAFAADAATRFHGSPAVALATAGPGATNTLTAIASAYLDSIPTIFLTGQVQSYLMKGARPVRQFALQECDLLPVAAPITKAALRAHSAKEVPEVLSRALEAALSGRPGPVLIELPYDVQAMPAPPDAQAEPVTVAPPSSVPASVADEVVAGLAAAERPAIIIGGGIRAAHAAERARVLFRRLGIPVALSIAALDILPHADPLRLGLVGMYGNRWANLALAESDFMLVLGSRLDHGVLGADVSPWSRGRKIVQVDCDPGEMRRVRGIVGIVADLGAFLDAALPAAAARTFPAWAAWHARIAELRAKWPDTAELAGCRGINPNVFMKQLSAASAAAAAFVVDAGQHLWWACQSIEPADGQRFLAALGLAPCGWAFPASVGVACTTRRPVVLLAGDGAFQFNIQEFQTVVRGHLPLKIVLLDNGSHGNVRQLQEQVFGGRYTATVPGYGYDVPDFTRVAAAYGVASRSVSAPDEVGEALRWLWQDENAPALLRVQVETDLNVYPNVPFGAPITTMESQPPGA